MHHHHPHPHHVRDSHHLTENDRVLVGPRTYPTAVAIDKDKNSPFAVKWAVDHLLINNPNLILIHVTNKNNINHSFSMTDASPEATREQAEAEMQQFFTPFRGFCSRKGVQTKEVVLEDMDVTKALVEYIKENLINNIVLGASARNIITRKFKNPDVPSGLTKSAPDFCAVYIIAKGKVVTVRSANRPVSSPANPPRQSTPVILQQLIPEANHEDNIRTAFVRGSGARSPIPTLLNDRSLERMEGSDYLKFPRPHSAKSSGTNINFEHMDSSTSNRILRSSHSRESFPEDIHFTSPSNFRPSDFGSEALEYSISSLENYQATFSQPSRDVEAEMKRLKLELKQTMDMYSTACKEAITAKQKAVELHRWNIEEARKFEEARMAEEAALAMVEREKMKCKAAMEAAEAAQRMAELEAQKRRHAEMKARKEAEEKKRALNALANNDIRYRKYTIDEIEQATNYFSESLKIGEGGYGSVYKASLNHTQVAIKVLRPDAAQGRKQFQQEVEVLSCIRHPNMVLLLGACPEYGCLVYEYMDNGSLEDRLYRRGDTPPIPWRIRFKIAAEIATALLFLHQTKPEPIVHRDLKPANILLNMSYVSKISDVGLSRLVPPSVADTVTQYRMTSTAGTFCYIDPEYQQTGMLGVKSDIYSLGVMLLQLVTAKPPMGLTHYVERAIEKETFEDMLDKSITDWPMEEVIRYAKMALKCAELRRKDRPDLATVILPELNRLKSLEGGGGNSVGNDDGMELGLGASLYTFTDSSYRPSSPHSHFDIQNDNGSGRKVIP